MTELISLGVKSDNTAAIKLYESLGFEVVGRHRDYFKLEDSYYDELLMDLALEKKPGNVR